MQPRPTRSDPRPELHGSVSPMRRPVESRDDGSVKGARPSSAQRGAHATERSLGSHRRRGSRRKSRRLQEAREASVPLHVQDRRDRHGMEGHRRDEADQPLPMAVHDARKAAGMQRNGLCDGPASHVARHADGPRRRSGLTMHAKRPVHRLRSPTGASLHRSPRRSRHAATCVALLFLCLMPPASADAAKWRSCRTFATTNYSGARVVAASIRVRRTTCAQARRVVRGFYNQVIGSSGAGYAAGYGCAYYGRARVRCGSGADGQGPRKLRWKERT